MKTLVHQLYLDVLFLPGFKVARLSVLVNQLPLQPDGSIEVQI